MEKLLHLRFPKQEMNALKVAGIFLFGSYAQGVAHPKSDIDLGVLLEDPHILLDIDQKNNIYDRIYDLVSSQVQKLINIDIVFLQAADLQLCFHVIRDGKLFYIGDSLLIGNFIDQTMILHADFAPHRRQFHQAILDRI